MKTIRASEIGSYLYCHRAWMYQRRGMQSANRAELAAGTELHRQHGRSLLAASLLQGLAWLALLGVLVILLVYLLQGLG